MAWKTAMYLCNGKAPCSNLKGCVYGNVLNLGGCRYTTSAEYAKYGPCSHPETDPFRFDREVVRNLNGDPVRELYIEKEAYYHEGAYSDGASKTAIS